ncbi:hypothetical protein KPH14_012679, partial [Odynerus spinipes]
MTINLPGSNPLLVAVVYRPPKAANLSAFCNDYDALAIDFASSVIFGDFNANLLGSSYETADVRDFCVERALYIVPFNATCHTHSSDTFLDLCILSDQSLLHSFSQTSTPFIACHDAIYVSLRVNVPRRQTGMYLARSYRRLNPSAFTEDLASKDWGSVVRAPSVDDMVSGLHGFILAALDAHAPFTRRCRSRLLTPWITQELHELRRERDRCYRVYRRTKSHGALLRYREKRDIFHKRISDARTSFYTERLAGISNPSLLWRELRNLGIASSQAKSNIIPFSPDDLNRHFAATAQWPNAGREIYLHVEPSNLSGAIERLNRDVSAVLEWATENALNLNTHKTQVLILGSAPFLTHLNTALVPPVLFDGVPLPYLDSARNLGLLMDPKLSWTKHVQAISMRVHLTLRQLSASRRFLSKSLHLASKDWGSVVRAPSVDDMVSGLHGFILAALDAHAPFTRRCRSRLLTPWITQELHELRRERDRCYRVYRRTKSHGALLRYREKRDILHKRISDARTSFYTERLAGISNPSLLWRELRNLGIASSQAKSNIIPFSPDDLNRHFAAIAQWPNAGRE